MLYMQNHKYIIVTWPQMPNFTVMESDPLLDLLMASEIVRSFSLLSRPQIPNLALCRGVVAPGVPGSLLPGVTIRVLECKKGTVWW